MVKNPEFSEAYFIDIFSGAEQIFFDSYLAQYGQGIPEVLTRFLRLLNGFHFCDFKIYKLTPSLYKSSEGLLDRSVQLPLDIGTANEIWKHDFERSDFHFGGRYFDDERNCGYSWRMISSEVV